MPGNWTMVIFSRWTILPPTFVQKRDWTSTSAALMWMCPMAAPAALGAASWANAGVAISTARASRSRVFMADYSISIVSVARVRRPRTPRCTGGRPFRSALPSPRGKTRPPAPGSGCGVGWVAPVAGEPTGQPRGRAARVESPTAFGQRCIPPGCVAPRSNIPDILTRRALPAGRIAGLGATPDFHHGLLGASAPGHDATSSTVIAEAVVKLGGGVLAHAEYFDAALAAI